jgi:hypothetical protein
MTEISIDTAVYERRHGQPLGRAFWTFKIISPSVTSKTTSSRRKREMSAFEG